LIPLECEEFKAKQKPRQEKRGSKKGLVCEGDLVAMAGLNSQANLAAEI